jgi:bacterioferritin-associated ferredoxin
MDDLDAEICFCQHVTKRKLLNFIARRRPARSEQLSECLGAGTACGFCRSRLRALFLETCKKPA